MHTPGEGCAPGALQQTAHPAPTLGQKFPPSAWGGLLASVSPTHPCVPQSWGAEPVPIPKGLVALRVIMWRGKRLHSQGILMGARNLM